jgi:hypothetical protein
MRTGTAKAWVGASTADMWRKLTFAWEHLCRRGLRREGFHFWKNVPSKLQYCQLIVGFG